MGEEKILDDAEPIVLVLNDATLIQDPAASCDPCDKNTINGIQTNPGDVGLLTPSCDTDSEFSRLVVSYLHRGQTEVFYELDQEFIGEHPFTFTLQVSDVLNKVSNWRDVGEPVIDEYSIVATGFRPVGKLNRAAFRVKLETADAQTKYSDPVGVAGTLSRQDWLLAQSLLRQHQLQLRNSPGGQMGYLLKRRITGELCPDCSNYLTQEVEDPNCHTCWGTGRKCGFYYPMSCVWADIDPKTYRAYLDNGQARGTIQDITIRAKMVNTWMLGEGDVWVNAVTDDRYYVHTVQNLVEIRGVPLVANVELRVPPYTDVIYDFVIPDRG